LELHLVQDSRLLAFAIAVALAATLLSGLTPALRTSQIGREAQPFSLRRWLVAGQFAFAFVLLVSATLFIRSLAKMSHADPGFDAGHLLTAEMNVDARHYSEARAEHYFEDAMSEIRRLPGVRSVSGAAVVPLGIEHWVMSMKAGDRIIQRVHVNSVTPGYFEAMRIALLRGRDFLASDRRGAMPVAIVNQTFARKYFNNNAIEGRVFIPHRPQSAGAAPVYSSVRVIGIVADSKYGSLGEDPAPALYWPYLQEYRPLVLEISIHNSPAGALTAVREAISHLDPQTPITLQLMQERLAGALLPGRMASVLLGTIGALGMLLAAIGIYGAMAFNVSRRTAEIGMRLALGATQRDVLRLILRDAFRLALLGMATGFLMALLFTRPLAGLLSTGLSVTDPLSFGGVGAVLIAVALAAAATPAWRASRIDPMVALRHE
jgi:putative ABC transport system permease protein